MVEAAQTPRSSASATEISNNDESRPLSASVPPHTSSTSTALHTPDGLLVGNRLPCPSCPETFARAEHLTRHLRKHTGEKPYVCGSCGKVFSRSDSMKRHESLHLTARRPKKSSRRHSFRPAVSTIEPVGSGANRPHPHRSVTYNNYPDNRPKVSSLSPTSSRQIQPAQDFQASGSGAAIQKLGNAGPSVMSDINWFPLTEPSEIDLNPYEFFWESFHDWTADANTDSQGQKALANNTLNDVSVDAPLPGFTVRKSPPRAQSPNSQVLSPLYSVGASSDASVDENDPTLSCIRSSSGPHGESYVDGGVTRLPRGRKRRTSTISSSMSPPNRDTGAPRYRFSPVLASGREGNASNVYVNQQTYDSILRAFRYTCTGNATPFTPFETERFLDLPAVEELVGLAVDHFLPTLPFIHQSTLRTQRNHWTLYLALAAIGAHYGANVDDVQVYSFNELLRRTLTILNEQKSLDDEIDKVQAKVLASIALLHSRNSTHEDAGKSIFRDLVHFYDRNFKSDPASPFILPTWKAWIREQSNCRTAYAIWLIDCMMGYQLAARTLLHLDDANLPLPGAENIWQSSNEEEFVRSSLVVNPSLKTATETLYMEKMVNPGIGEYGRILLVHALFRQTWGKLKESQSRLSAWEPHAKAQQSPTTPSTPSSDAWPPGLPLYSKWRNAACDCLDVLHWHANSVIGAKSGYEHPTVLFLHLARVVLLSPLDMIRDIAISLADGKALSGPRAHAASSELFRWAHEDCYKARLAIIHAGALLYHVRRHSLDSFYEPSAIFLSILCLWAYGAAHARKSAGSDVAAAEEETSGAPHLPEFIHLDRPCDDELVQLFITNGNKITPNITGVGNLCAREGPRKLLKLGCSNLRSARNWDPKGKYEGILTRLQARSADLEHQASVRNINAAKY